MTSKASQGPFVIFASEFNDRSIDEMAPFLYRNLWTLDLDLLYTFKQSYYL